MKKMLQLILTLLSMSLFVLLNELSKMKIEKENLHPYKMFCKTTSNMQKHGINRNTPCIPNQEIDYLLKVIHLGDHFQFHARS